MEFTLLADATGRRIGEPTAEMNQKPEMFNVNNIPPKVKLGQKGGHARIAALKVRTSEGFPRTIDSASSSWNEINRNNRGDLCFQVPFFHPNVSEWAHSIEIIPFPAPVSSISPFSVAMQAECSDSLQISPSSPLVSTALQENGWVCGTLRLPPSICLHLSLLIFISLPTESLPMFHPKQQASTSTANSGSPIKTP